MAQLLLDLIFVPQVRVDGLNSHKWPWCFSTFGHATWPPAHGDSFRQMGPFTHIGFTWCINISVPPWLRGRWAGLSKLVKLNANVTSPWFSRTNAIPTHVPYLSSPEMLVNFCLCPFSIFVFFSSSQRIQIVPTSWSFLRSFSYVLDFLLHFPPNLLYPTIYT